MTRKTLIAVATAGLVALGGVAAGPASAATCPAGQHWVDLGGAMGGTCVADTSGGAGSGSGTVTVPGGGNGSYGQAPPAPVYHAPPAPVFQNPYTPPVHKPAPVRPTAAKVGTVLKAAPATWAKGTLVKYRWTRNGALVATTPTYRAKAADKGKTIAVTVTGTKSGHTTTKPAKKYIIR